MKLPPQSWIEGPGAQAIIRALDVPAGVTRLVGGAVRDALLGLPVSDVDLATRLLPDEVMRRLGAAGVKAVPTGIDHGTVTAVADGLVAEVTTLRRDVSTDGRRAIVAFTEDWREDAARRDFTFNALSANPLTGEVFDYFGGVDDLQRRHVRFIGNPLDRIAEDHLRILRFFRFHARFDGDAAPDPEALRACAARANDLMALSRERIRDELLKLLAVDDPEPTVRLMIAHGIFTPVLPEVTDAGALTALAAAERAADMTPDPLRRLAALLPPDADVAEDVGRRLKLSNAGRKRLSLAAARCAADLARPPFALAYYLGAEGAADRLLLLGAPAENVRGLADWARPKLPVSGGALIKRGVAPGPAVSGLLKRIETDWVEAGFPLDAASIEEIINGRLKAAI